MELHVVAAALIAATAPGEANPAGSYAVELLGAGGGLALIVLTVKTAMDVLKGRADKEVTRNASLTEQRDTAWRERDEERACRKQAEARANCEARNARKLWDYAARLRRELVLTGAEPQAQEPTLEQCERLSETPDRY